MPEQTAVDERSHPDLQDLSDGDTVRVVPDDADPFVGTVDDVRHTADGDVHGHGVTVVEEGHRGDVWDLEAQHDPQDGWGDVMATERQYLADETLFIDRGPATVEPIDPGINPDRLDPGVTVEHVDTHHYRVVVPPWEREYDDAALAFDLDSGANVCEKIDPAEVVRRVE